MSKPLHYFSRLSPERVDAKEGIVRGVSIITGGVQAKGHPLGVDSETVREFYAACEAKGKVKTKANHKSGVKEVNGYLSDFRVVSCPTGEKLIGDWHLLKKDPNYEHTLEIAERMPDTVGLSGSFTSPKGFEKGEKTKHGPMARVKEVLSVDFVTDPAANPDGLFEIGDETVDTEEKNMAKPTTEELLEQILANQTELQAEIGQIKEFNDALVAEREEAEETNEQIYVDDKGNEYTQSEVDAIRAQEEGGGEGEDSPLAEELAALRAEIHELKARNEELDQAEEIGKYETALSMLREKVTLLAAQRDEAILELESYKTPRVSASSDGARLFSRGSANQTEFEAYVSEQVAAGKKRTEAITDFIRENPEAYQQHLESKEPVGAIRLNRN
jgi:hypothetical protein